LNNNYWQGKRLFITGCSGLLGSWLTAELIRKGASVLGLIHSDPSSSLLAYMGTIEHIESVQGDIRDFALITKILVENPVDIIFHLAAQTQVGVANRDPMTTFDTNIKGTWTLLEAARCQPHPPGLVIASSDKAYGEQPGLPYREETPLLGQHPYDVSKACADLIARTYAHSYGLPVAIARCANLYGGGDLNWRRIVPGTIRSVLRGERPVVRSDGTAKRNYIFVQDAVRGYLTLGQNLHRPDVCGEAFNFGVEAATTALDMIQTIISLSPRPYLQPIVLNEAQNEIQEQHLCSRKARKTLDWQPRYSLENGLHETISWYKRYLAKKAP
jgi:CDP-glucose 4,6-dehydratase